MRKSCEKGKQKRGAKKQKVMVESGGEEEEDENIQASNIVVRKSGRTLKCSEILRRMRERESSSSNDSDVSEESDSDDDPFNVCFACKAKYPPLSKRSKTDWICCDACDNWFHVVCEKASTADLKRDSYICKNCLPC